ncbi:MAG: hypothetical protein KJ622_11265 [Alphaproteobacteria bacterium]|nr:hypothetical protein [Alphaproteobacteria bacterium]
MDFDDLDEQKTPDVLINKSNEERDVGYDTINASMGNLGGAGSKRPAPVFGIMLCPDDALHVVGGLTKLAELGQAQNQEQLVSRKANSHKVDYGVVCWMVSSDATRRGFDVLPKNGSSKFKLEIRLSNRRTTMMEVKVNRDTNGHYWLSIRANPTSLLNGYNAFAVAIPGRGKHAERRIIMRVVFQVLRAILRSVDAGFEWHADTKGRIKKLAFRICPAQVFTYMIARNMTPAQIIGYLRCVYSVPYSNGKHHRLLCDDLGIEVQSKAGPDGVETLLLIFRKGGRVTWSVNFYDKLAKAKSDAVVIDLNVGDESVLKFLASAVRVDVTIHEGGQREMQREAKIATLEDAVVTASNYCQAIKIMDAEEGRSGKRFVRWLLDHIFGDLMKLWVLLSYVPSKLEGATKLIEGYNSDAAAGFIEWCHLGFEFVSNDGFSKGEVRFEKFLTDHAERKVSRAVARKARQMLLKFGIDPDIPLRAYDAFYNLTFIWNLSDEDRHKLAEAQETGDDKTASRLRKRSRGNSVELANDITRTFKSMITSAHTPANTLGAADKEEEEED